jgi:CRISPR/Cas system-associated protein endoribonuclease Cas2
MTFSIFLLAIAGNAEGLIPIDNLSQYYGDHGNITALTLTENSIPEIKDVEFYRNHTQAKQLQTIWSI